jgi:methyl-accepting chemotaxis protein
MTSPADPPAPSSSPIARTDFSSSLHRRFLVGASVTGVVTILLLAATAYQLLERDIVQRGDAALREAAHRASLVLTVALDERAREADVLALTPEVIAAARDGAARAAALRLPGTPIAALETRFATEHSLQLDPATRQLLRTLLPHLSARDLLLTDTNGYNALITDRSADFVQSDETWWQDAWRTGRSISDAAFDSASRSSVIAIASVIRDGDTRLGVLKIKFDVTPLVTSLATSGAGIRVDVIDSAGGILLSSDSSAMGHALGGISARDSLSTIDLQVGTDRERAIARSAGADRWAIVAHQPRTTIDAPFRSARMAILVTAAVLLAVLIALLFAIHRFLTRRMTDPVIALARAAEAVAAGNFAVEVAHSTTDDEIGRLGRAVGSMVIELRRLARAITDSTNQTTTMSAEITAGSEEMAATAGEIASTASDLSAQSTQMAETIGTLASSATVLRGLAGELETGALDGVARNGALRALAAENRAGLDASALSLDSLSDDVQASARAIDALAEASNEIRSFVTLVRKLARQSKLLALNAAMEAARAGEQGEGFAVVASEVRRLATMSSEAAERTEAVVTGVLGRIDESRESARRAVDAGANVRSSTARATASFAEIERAVAEAEQWTTAVQHTSNATSQLVADMTVKLDELTGNTDTFAAAMEQVAASSEEQSAATEEIAAAANTMVAAAERLNQLVGGLELGEPASAAAETSDHRSSATSAPLGAIGLAAFADAAA